MNMNLDSITLVIVLIVTNILTPLIAYKIARRQTKDDFNDKALQKRYHLIYVPLRTLLIETHITSASIGFYFDQRVKRSLPYFRRFKIKEGIRRLSKSFGSNPLHEVEFGREFPLDEIKKCVVKQSKWADAKLLNLIQRADRSTYESRAHSLDGKSDGLLEREKYELAMYVQDTYEELNDRLMPE